MKLVEFTEKLLQQRHIRIIGVCFGHQILGRALGVKVGRSDDGWEVSVLPVELSARGKEIFQQDTLVSQEASTIDLCHIDPMIGYPPNAQRHRLRVSRRR